MGLTITIFCSNRVGLLSVTQHIIWFRYPNFGNISGQFPSLFLVQIQHLIQIILKTSMMMVTIIDEQNFTEIYNRM